MSETKPLDIIIPAASQFSMRKAREMEANAPKINFQYAGAKTTRFRDFLTYKGSQSESQLLPYFDRLTIITRLRQLVRDDPYAAALLSAYPTQMGTSTMSSLSGVSESEDAAESAFNDGHESAWHEFAKRVEYSGLSLHEVEQILWREDLIAGELFFLKLKNGRLQMIPSEFCFSDYAYTLPDSPEADGIVIEDGVVTGYRFGYRDKYGTLQVGKEITPAENVIHFFFQDRPEQRRGVPRLSSVLNVLQDIYEICNAKVNQVKTQSFISGVVTKNYAPADTADMMRLTNSDGTRSDYQDLRGGTLYYMETGEDMKPFQSSINANDFDEFLKSRLEAVGGAVGMPPECWIEGFRDSNYSSARATVSTWIRTVAARRMHAVCKFLEPVHDFWLEKNPGLLKGGDPKEVVFTFPGVPAIDESKQNDADAKALAACLTTYAQVYGSKGQFWDTQFKQIQREKQRMAALNITPNFSPSSTAGGGAVDKSTKPNDDRQPSTN
jgi:capsid protein